MTSKKTILGALFATGISLCSAVALAAVSAEEAKQLGTTLTEFGAEKAGNKDGSIPAYTGGLALKDVPGYDPKTSLNFVDPYKNDKVLYSVSAKNMAQYDDLLTPGHKAMMAMYPDFRIDVYPTHRGVRYPSWTIQNTLKNATTAKLGGEIEGDAVLGADKGNLPFAGIPFPIPKTGYEVMWNYRLHVGPCAIHINNVAYLVDAAGNPSLLTEGDQWHVRPWYDKSKKLRPQTFDATQGFSSLMTGPPSSAGIVFLNFYLPNSEQKVWFYTPGQRRVRLAPEFAYDVPIAAYGGVLTWDEPFGFSGRMDRFNFKLVGKKEMLVPYNSYRLQTADTKDSLRPKFLNPDVVRFEKHRVWVVDATRKPNVRHVNSRRTFYIDEDSWHIVAEETYDNAGKIWRVFAQVNHPDYVTGGIYSISWGTYDLIKGNYFITNTTGNKGGAMHTYDSSEGLDIHLTPQSVAAGSVR